MTHNLQYRECPLFVLLVENWVLDFKICITKLPAEVLSSSTMLMNSTLLTQTRQDLSKVDCYTS